MRGGKTSLVSVAKQLNHWVPSHHSSIWGGPLKFGDKVALDSRIGGNSLSPFYMYISSVKRIRTRTAKEAKNWHACGWHAPLGSLQQDEVGAPPSVSSPLPSPPFLPASSLHHLALTRSARLLTTCASAGPALAPGLIVHW